MTVETRIGGSSSKSRRPSNLDEEGVGEKEWKEQQAAKILEKQSEILKDQALIPPEQAQGLLEVLGGQIKYHSLEIRAYQPASYQDNLKELIEKLNGEQTNIAEQLEIHRVKVNRYKQPDRNVTGYFLIGKKKDYDFIETDKKRNYE